MAYVLGVDRGTTFTAAAVVRDRAVSPVALGAQTAAMPSVVALPAGGAPLVGDEAEQVATSDPSRAAREFKRRLGDPTPVLLGGTPYGAEALMAVLLRAVVDAATVQERGAPSVTILSHPANYGPYKKDLLLETVRQADPGRVRFVTEPEAAAIAYHAREAVPAGEVIAVYDFGGGTFDAALLRSGTGRTDAGGGALHGGFELIGTPEGIERLGGIDFDVAVIGHVDQALGGLVRELRADDPQVLVALAALRAACQAAKEVLSGAADATIPVRLPNVVTEVRITRDELEAMIRPRVEQTMAAMERAVRSASLNFDEIGRILLVGGSSRMPIIGEMVREATGRPTSLEPDPKIVVARGAALAGAQQVAAPEPRTVIGPIPLPVPPSPAGLPSRRALPHRHRSRRSSPPARSPPSPLPRPTWPRWLPPSPARPRRGRRPRWCSWWWPRWWDSRSSSCCSSRSRADLRPGR